MKRRGSCIVLAILVIITVLLALWRSYIDRTGFVMALDLVLVGLGILTKEIVLNPLVLLLIIVCGAYEWSKRKGIRLYTGAIEEITLGPIGIKLHGPTLRELLSKSTPGPPKKDLRPVEQVQQLPTEPDAPLTFQNLLKYEELHLPGFDWSSHTQMHYEILRRLHVNTMGQVQEAITDPDSRGALTKIYQQHLGRQPDWVGIFAHQPVIYLRGEPGLQIVEQGVKASPEYAQRQIRCEQQ